MLLVLLSFLCYLNMRKLISELYVTYKLNKPILYSKVIIDKCCLVLVFIGNRYFDMFGVIRFLKMCLIIVRQTVTIKKECHT